MTNSLTPLLMHSDKRNLIMAIATALISSLFNIALSGDVPFCQLQRFQCLHRDSTKAHLCSPLYYIPFFLTAFVMICGTRVNKALVRDFGKCSASRGCFFHYSLLGMLVKCSNSWEQNEM